MDIHFFRNAAIIMFHSVFIILFTLNYGWRRVFPLSIDVKNNASPHRKMQSRILYNFSLSFCFLIFLTYAANGVWTIIQNWDMIFSHFLITVSCLSIVLESITWLLVALQIFWHGETWQHVPTMIWLWYLSSFIFHVSLSALDMGLFIKSQEIFLDDLIKDVVPIPFCTLVLLTVQREKSICISNNHTEIEEPLIKKQRNVFQLTPFVKTNIWSVLTFTWINPLLKLGYHRTLDVEDVPNCAEENNARNSYKLLQTNWEHELLQEEKLASLSKTILISVWRGMMINGLFAIAYTCATYVGPYLINHLVEYLGGMVHFQYEGYVLVSAFFGAKMIETLFQRQWYFGAQTLGICIRSGLTSLVYRKGLGLSSKARQKYNTGEIINYMSVDIDRIERVVSRFHEIWLLPLQVLLAFFILYKHFGIASIAGIIAMIGVMVSSFPFVTLQKKYQGNVMKEKDSRVKVTLETLKNMKIIKLHGWEMLYSNRIGQIRGIEMVFLKKYLYTSCATVFLFWVAPTMVAVVTFSVSVLMGKELTIGRVFSALATFRILQEPIYNLPDLISLISQCSVSLKRIATFIKEEEMLHSETETTNMELEDIAVELVGAEFSWDPNVSQSTLSELTLQIKKGMKVAVCGLVGSGKSSLLSGIAGEIPKISGLIKVNGSIAYLPQLPWIQSMSIQDNILFGMEMDSLKYDSVVQGCSLDKDFEFLSHGDKTEIGERGINLSGGQKQRIQLARALYQDADIYLIDDPFSAVDSHTGAKLYKDCLFGLLASKTVIYVTNQIQFLPEADLILVMQNGKLVYAGEYERLEGSSDFSMLIGAQKRALANINGVQNLNKEIKAQEERVDGSDCEGNFQRDDTQDQTIKIEENMLQQIVQKEERETGRVKMKVYFDFINAAYGGALVPLILGAHILFQVLQIGSSYWMACASPTEQNHGYKTSYKKLIVVYLFLSLGSSLSVLVRSLFLAKATLKTAQKLFTQMLTSIMHAPMSFFDSTPTSRILNRISTDQSKVDMDIPYRLAGLAFAVFQLVGIVVIVSQGTWQVFSTLLPLLVISIGYRNYYIPSATELARLVGIAKAPIIHHFTESLSGAAIIRSFNQETRFLNTNLHLCDNYSKLLFHNDAAMGWFCLRLNLLANVLFLASLVVMVILPKDKNNPSIAALAATYGLDMNVVQAWVVWNLCNVETKMISVERIMQYCDVSCEAPWTSTATRKTDHWPSKGSISFQNVIVRYAPHLPLILKGISCDLLGGRNIGIVGRTGSGKSTIVQVLFRIVEPTAGKITIDGVDIVEIGLHELRSRMSIIPQDPVLFEGTLRDNIDPLNEYSDIEIWEALEKCQLGEMLRSKQKRLDTMFFENGENWSMGQRQLICLGRAFLKHSKIIVMDEATASVDGEAERIIHDIVRSDFSKCTIINIAHKITTVIESDMVIVINEGRISEYDSPSKLLQNEASYFAKLISEYSARSIDPN